MKILLVLNKTLTRNGVVKFDSGYFNVYVPLLELGHEVYLFDTNRPKTAEFDLVVKVFKPDLIFCCLSGNSAALPNEPIEEIEAITKEGLIKTFNWFCDDTWRFESFSKEFCHKFTVCSTPEIDYIDKFKKEANYNNIILGQWHCNPDFYIPQNKIHKVGFVGGITSSRAAFVQKLHQQVDYLAAPSYEEMFLFYSCCKIGLNMTVNDNDLKGGRQMKLRIFEVPCSNSLLVTETTNNIEKYFIPDKEIITFNSVEECNDKLEFYLKNDSERERITQNGRARFLEDHTSRERLSNLLEEIQKF